MRDWKIIAIVFALCGMVISEGLAQRINFSTWTGSEDVTIRAVGPSLDALKFNDKKRVLLANTAAVAITKQDPQVVIYEIEAPSELDITVELTYPPYLYKDKNTAQSNTQVIPFALFMGYSNEGLGIGGAIPPAANSIDVPPGFNSITFPMSRRAGGAPLPPSPEFGGFARPKTKVHVYVYGTLGPIGNVNAGDYSADVVLSVYVADNN